MRQPSGNKTVNQKQLISWIFKGNKLEGLLYCYLIMFRRSIYFVSNNILRAKSSWSEDDLFSVFLNSTPTIASCVVKVLDMEEVLNMEEVSNIEEVESMQEIPPAVLQEFRNTELRISIYYFSIRFSNKLTPEFYFFQKINFRHIFNIHWLQSK